MYCDGSTVMHNTLNLMVLKVYISSECTENALLIYLLCL